MIRFLMVLLVLPISVLIAAGMALVIIGSAIYSFMDAFLEWVLDILYGDDGPGGPFGGAMSW